MKPTVGGQYWPPTEEGIRKVHDSALALLSEIGVEVHSKLAFGTLQAHKPNRLQMANFLISKRKV